jgi:hypothetical protein
MKRITVAVFVIMSAICFLVLAQPGIGADQADITGTWKGKGVDKRGVKWDFTFTLTQKENVIEGEGVWEGSDNSTGKTNMKGTIDLAKKTFILKDVDLNDVSGNVLAATYTGSFSADFKKMTGKWTIPKGSPGTFEAEKE